MNLARLRNILIGSAGNLVEWYDFYAYSSLSIYFATVFFPKADYTAQLLSAAAIFAVGFLMRPIGAWLMGVYGDRHGRKAGLTLSVALMAGGSLLIAVAPTYATAGLLAPAILLVARLMQGLSVGGEYGASATYLSEMASRAHRGFWSSFQYVTLVGGQLLSLAVLLLLQSRLSEAELTAWGWRIPFAIGTLLALLVYWLRRHLEETASFQGLHPDREKSSIAALWRDHRREVLLVAAITAGGSCSFYAYTTYLQKFLVNTAHLDKPAATEVMTVALFLFMLLQPAFGWLADRVGRKPLLLLFGIGGMLASVPVFGALAGVRSPGEALPLVMIPLVLTAAYTSISAVVKAELFPAGLRTLGVALPYAIGNALFGGTAEYVALWFKQAGREGGFAWYVTALLAVATIAFLLLPETRRTSRIAED
ncbi:MFS transporter [Sphingomonas ginkgonis]|uniref:MFS transporter n=1 Tax=Sphingomonas ginkgonis TaxID=2315330 RepID=A0A3R9WQ28_9SPHN|nr:MFS transporter [Sphingomonas ginkgonis]RST31651.1 MFS transporter [Sphingomonas ginkgonis]